MTTHQDIHIFTGNLARRLQSIYAAGFSEGHVNRIISLIREMPGAGPLWNERDVILITYGNSVVRPDEKPLITLRRFLTDKLGQKISCVHILPFFPSTSDDGFAVSDFNKVDPALGSWEDIEEIGRDYSLMFDLVLNHVSSGHPWFLNYCSDRVPGKDYFIEKIPDTDYHLVVRPRSTGLFTEFKTGSGKKEVWTTFSADQADLNFANPDVLIEMIRILLFYISKGARIIRLDAIAFLWKEPGSPCLHHHKTHEIVKLLREIAAYANPRVIILTETNVPNPDNWSYFGQNDEAHMVYQFSLPPLILYTLFSGNSQYLTDWAESIPPTGHNKTFLNFTASHDGIGVRPLEGILPPDEIQRLIDSIKSFGGRLSVKTNPDGSTGPYEMNITYFSAMAGTIHGKDALGERRFLASQFIMLAMQGIPAVYIQSLLGCENDEEGVKKTGMARSINRRKWYETEITEILSADSAQARVFEEFTRVIAIRQNNDTFHPDCPQQVLRLGNSFFGFLRLNPANGKKIYCISNITASSQYLNIESAALPQKGYDLLSEQAYDEKNEIYFEGYQTRWLV
jgi:sucrose phosphorylase